MSNNIEYEAAQYEDRSIMRKDVNFMAGFNGIEDAGNVKRSEIVNNLTNTDPTKVLGAPQGKALNEMIQNTAGCIADFTTTDGKYYKRVLHSDSSSRIPFIILRNSQREALAPIGATWNRNNTNTMFFSENTVTWDAQTNTISIYCGSSAWAMPIIICPYGEIY